MNKVGFSAQIMLLVLAGTCIAQIPDNMIWPDSVYWPDSAKYHRYSVWLPPGYNDADNTKRYPVVYELQNFSNISFIRSKLLGTPQWEGREFIVVKHDPGGEGCIYSEGNYWYKPWNYERVFIDHLIPRVDSMFRTIDDRHGRSVIGVSKAGSGSLRIALKYPQLYAASCSIDGVMMLCDYGTWRSFKTEFWNYYVAPHDFFAGNIVLNYPAVENTPIRLFGGSNSGMSFWDDNVICYGMLRQIGLKQVKLTKLNCSHGNLCTDALKMESIDTLRANLSFEGTLKQPVVTPSGAGVDECQKGPVTFTAVNPNAAGEIRYTTNGTVPKRTSPRYIGPITVTITSIFSARVFSPGDSSAAKTSLVRIQRPNFALPDTLPGISYRAYAFPAGDITKPLSQLMSREPAKTGVMPEISIDKQYRATDNNFGFSFEGLFDAARDGVYGFSSRVRGPHRMWVDTVLIFSYDSAGPSSLRYAGGKTALEKGLHTFKYEIAAETSLDFVFGYRRPDTLDVAVSHLPSSLLFHTTDPTGAAVDVKRFGRPAVRFANNPEGIMVDIRGRLIGSHRRLPKIAASGTSSTAAAVRISVIRDANGTVQFRRVLAY